MEVLGGFPESGSALPKLESTRYHCYSSHIERVQELRGETVLFGNLDEVTNDDALQIALEAFRINFSQHLTKPAPKIKTQGRHSETFIKGLVAHIK